MGTFGSVTTVRLGIYAAQKGLDVTGNNITNINTQGYTRQRITQVSLVAGAPDRYSSIYTASSGQGALVTGITQLRDVGLDLSYRKALSDVGSADATLGGLNKLATILDEVGKGSLEQDDGVLLSQMNDLRDLISKAAANGVDAYDGLIRASAQSLASLFNSYADKLAELKETYTSQLDQQVDKVNEILENIQKLNVAIRNSDIRGDAGLELRDQRNMLLDELSQYAKIDVKYSMDEIGSGTQLERLTITLATGSKDVLVDGEYAAQLSQECLKRNPKFDPDAPIEGDNLPYLDANDKPADKEHAAVLENADHTLVLGPLTNERGEKKDPADFGSELGNEDLYGSLQSLRDLLNGKGEFSTQADVDKDPGAVVNRGIPYYQKMLDSLAFEFAEVMNQLNNEPNTASAGNLFSTGSNTDDATNITAANIAVSKSWADGKVSIQAVANASSPSGDTSNLAKFLAAFEQKHTFAPGDVSAGALGDSYEGSFEDMLLRIQSTLAQDQKSTDAVLNNYLITADDIYMDREGVSGVDLNDEATSLMTYQKAYTAACRLLTVLEEAIDSLINGTV